MKSLAEDVCTVETEGFRPRSGVHHSVREGRPICLQCRAEESATNSWRVYAERLKNPKQTSKILCWKPAEDVRAGGKERSASKGQAQICLFSFPLCSPQAVTHRSIGPLYSRVEKCWADLVKLQDDTINQLLHVYISVQILNKIMLLLTLVLVVSVTSCDLGQVH